MGPQRMFWLGQSMIRWMCDESRLRRQSVSVRRPNFFCDAQWCKARIVDKRIEKGAQVVDLALSVFNHFDETTAQDTAVSSCLHAAHWITLPAEPFDSPRHRKRCRPSIPSSSLKASLPGASPSASAKLRG